MLFEAVKKTDYLRSLPVVLIVILFSSISALLHAQAPTIDPLRSVNTATGEMQFALPLGDVPGISGNGYSAMLSYKAGIQLHQPASAAGLGFSYEAGSISRKVIFVPDDNTGSNRSYLKNTTASDCDASFFYWAMAIISVVMSIVFTILAIVFPPAGAPTFFVAGGVISSFIGLGMSINGLFSVSEIEFNSSNYIAGGVHEGAYKPVTDKTSTAYGQGFFHGGAGDLPDIYFVNTQYLSGTMYPLGAKDGNNIVTFKLVRKDGSPNSNAVIIYNVQKEQFEITLNDGTKIYLGGTAETIRRNSVSTSKMFSSKWGEGSGGQVSCYNFETVEQRQDVPSEWLIRKVLSADYVDGDNDVDKNPLSSSTPNKGGWVAFAYDKVGPVDARQLPLMLQMGTMSTLLSYSGRKRDPSIAGDADAYTLTDIYLSSVHTPLGKVVYNYTDDRKDELWFTPGDFDWDWCEPDPPNDCDYVFPPADYVHAVHANVQPIARKVLSNIAFYNAENVKLKTVELKTSYTLRPSQMYSMIKDVNGGWANYADNGACLTLDGIKIEDRNNAHPLEIKFNYGYNPEGSYQSTGYFIPGGPYDFSYNIEHRDLWGYHLYSSGSTQNYFNETGEYSKAVQNGTTQAAAWSLESVLFPTGKEIVWEYESNRYDRCNGEVLGDGTVTAPRYGGGIRVKKITVNDIGTADAGKQKTIAYFYTSSDNSFTEDNTNSSGHATVEPFPYMLAADDDPRAQKARGGYYTPAKVCYEKVKVVEGYVPANGGGDGAIPNGYTVYDFYTPADFPNRGPYGNFDESWRHGFVKRVAQFNSTKKCIDEQQSTLGWFPDSRIIGYNERSGTSSTAYLGCGTVRTVSATQKSNKITSITNYEFADAVSSSTDQVTLTPEVYTYSIVPWTLTTSQNDGYSSIGKSGNFIGDGKPDVVALLHQQDVPTSGYPLHDKLELLVCWDLPVDPLQPLPATNYGIFTIADIAASQAGHFIALRLYVEQNGTGNINVYVSYKEGSSGNPTHYLKVANIYIDAAGILRYGGPVQVNAVAGNEGTEHLVTHDPTNGLIVRYTQPYIADRDGRPNRTITTNSDGKQLINLIVPAFTQSDYASMLTNNVLTPVCLSTTFEKDAGVTAVPNVVSSVATTWSQNIGVPSWVPENNFAWNSPLDANGKSTEPYAPFVFSAGATNANWDFTGSTVRYSPNSMAKETSKPTKTKNEKLYATTIYGYNGTLPVASVTNAQWRECGAFTGDYQSNGNTTEYWDFENGWEKGLAATGHPAPLLADNVTHFGQQVLFVENNYAAGRNNRIYPGKSYVMSAWVKVTSGRLYMAADYRSQALSADGNWPIPNTQLSTEPVMFDSVSIGAEDCAGEWKLLQLLIPASKTVQLANDPTKAYYSRAWVGNREYKGRCQNIYINHHAKKIAIKCSRNSCTRHGQEPFQ